MLAISTLFNTYSTLGVDPVGFVLLMRGLVPRFGHYNCCFFPKAVSRSRSGLLPLVLDCFGDGKFRTLEGEPFREIDVDSVKFSFKNNVPIAPATMVCYYSRTCEG